MHERIDAEIGLIRRRFPEARFVPEGLWVFIPSYPIPDPRWVPRTTDVAFQILPGHPGTRPYGFYARAGLRWEGALPRNYTEPAQNRPPLDGAWGLFSWQPADGQWRPTADIQKGSNLLNWVESFAVRFREGV